MEKKYKWKCKVLYKKYNRKYHQAYKIKPANLCILFLGVILMAGCTRGVPGSGKNNKELVKTGFAFNTTYTITLNSGGSGELLDECVSKCASYEKIFSRTLEKSELYNINEISKAYLQVKNNPGKKDIGISKAEEDIKSNIAPGNTTRFNINSDGSISFDVSEMMYGILEKGLYYSELSEGRFDITIEPESSLWDFTADNPEVPEDTDIKKAVKLVDYNNASLKDGKLIFKIPGMGIELGAIAKGYIADSLKEYLEANGVESGIINLGGNVLCIGKKPGGEPFHVGIQQPFAERNESIAAINAEDISVVSSGIYERYFMQDDKIYHHILDPLAGYPIDNGLVAITVVSEKSVDGDALSTACFALGLEKGMELINSLDNVYAVFITEDTRMHYSDGFEELIYN